MSRRNRGRFDLHGLSLGVLGISDRVSNDVLEAVNQYDPVMVKRRVSVMGELRWSYVMIAKHQNVQDLEDTSGLLVNQTRDSLDTTSSSETSDSRLGDTPSSQLWSCSGRVRSPFQAS